MTDEQKYKIEILFWPSLALFVSACVIEYLINVFVLLAWGKELWEFSFLFGWLLLCNLFLVFIVAYSGRDKRFRSAFLGLVIRGGDFRSLKAYVLLCILLSMFFVVLEVLIIPGGLVTYILQGFLVLYLLSAPWLVRGLQKWV